MNGERVAGAAPPPTTGATRDELLEACERAARAHGMHEQEVDVILDSLDVSGSMTWSIELECDFSHARRVYLTWKPRTVGSFPVAAALGTSDNEPFFDDETPSPSAVSDLVRRAIQEMRDLGKQTPELEA